MKPGKWSDPSKTMFPHQFMYRGDLLHDPEGTARASCTAVGIAFDAAALSWEGGDRSDVSWYGEGTAPWQFDPQKTDERIDR